MNVEGKTPEELFQDALFGMVRIMDTAKPKHAVVIKREISIEAPDVTSLLVDFLNEALAWMHVEREAYTSVQFRKLTEYSLSAELEGYRSTSFGKDIKAVTYHEADVKKDESGAWNTVLIFDI